jgi:hypothetical protein
MTVFSVLDAAGRRRSPAVRRRHRLLLGRGRIPARGLGALPVAAAVVRDVVVLCQSHEAS